MRSNWLNRLALHLRYLGIGVGALSLPTFSSAAAPQKPSKKIIMGYYWSNGNLRVSDVAFDKLTHVSHVGYHFDRSGSIVPDAENTRDEAVDLVAGAERHGAMPLLMIWGSRQPGCTGLHLSEALRSPSGIDSLAHRIVSLAGALGYRGDTIDWEYPGIEYSGERCEEGIWQPDRCQSDKIGLVALARNLKKLSPNFQIHVDLPLEGNGHCFDVQRLAQYVDYFQVMSYGLVGTWSKVSGHTSNLYRSDAPDCPPASVADRLLSWQRRGLSPEQMLVGIGFYGRRFSGTANARLCSTFEPGQVQDVPFYKLPDILNSSQWSLLTDERAGLMPYALETDGAGILVFEDRRSLALKMEYVCKNGYAGAMIWHVGYDTKTSDYLSIIKDGLDCSGP